MFGIAPVEEPYYRRVIEREKSLSQNPPEGGPGNPGASAVMVVSPPSGWDFGQCVFLEQDPRHPYAIELSVLGYPGFGVLDTIRGKIEDEEFSFPRDATTDEIVLAFPAAWRGRMVATGGVISVRGGTIENPEWTRTSPPTVPRYIAEETEVNTGRFFLGFSEEPTGLAFAETDAPTKAQLAALGFDDEGDPVPPDLDPYGFTTNGDSRVTVRFREVPFVCSAMTTPFRTLVDTSTPSPIASGALAYAAYVSGMGLSLLSIEPRVYQDLTGVFDDIAYDDADSEEVAP